MHFLWITWEKKKKKIDTKRPICLRVNGIINGKIMALDFMGKLWDAYFAYVGASGPCYNGTTIKPLVYVAPKPQYLNVSPLVLQLSLPNPLKPGVKRKMKMQLEQHRQVMLQLHLSDQQSYCLLRCDLY